MDTKITKEGKAEGEKKRTLMCKRKCSSTCSKTHSGNSLKFVKEPRGNFNDNDSIVEKNSSSRKMNN